MVGTELQWRVEQACFNAWPACRVALAGQWVVRLSEGPGRRINSANPLSPAARLAPADIAAAASLFAAAGRPAIFRIPDFLPQADAALDAAGYGPPEAQTRTLLRPPGALPPLDPRVSVTATPTAEWLAARERLSEGRVKAAREAAQLARLAVPGACAALVEQGRVVALAAAALSRGLIVLEAVVTDPAFRGRRLAEACCAALIAWGERGGADAACLQVQTDNEAARALYRRLGFATDLYGYHYRQR